MPLKLILNIWVCATLLSSLLALHKLWAGYSITAAAAAAQCTTLYNALLTKPASQLLCDYSRISELSSKRCSFSIVALKMSGRFVGEAATKIPQEIMYWDGASF